MAFESNGASPADRFPAATVSIVVLTYNNASVISGMLDLIPDGPRLAASAESRGQQPVDGAGLSVTNVPASRMVNIGGNIGSFRPFGASRNKPGPPFLPPSGHRGFRLAIVVGEAIRSRIGFVHRAALKAALAG